MEAALALTERARVELVEHDRVGRLVAGEDLVRQQRGELSTIEPALPELGLDLGGRLALHQRLGLREEVGEQDRVVVAERVVRGDGREEVGGDQLGPLR